MRRLRPCGARHRFEPLCRREPESPLEAPGVSGPSLGVDDTRGPLAVKRVEHLLGSYSAHVLPGLPGYPGGMRARDHIVELQQRMLLPWPLFGPDVATRAGDELAAYR